MKKRISKKSLELLSSIILIGGRLLPYDLKSKYYILYLGPDTYYEFIFIHRHKAKYSVSILATGFKNIIKPSRKRRYAFKITDKNIKDLLPKC